MFLDFLSGNDILLKDGTKRISDGELVAITLMIAESKPEEKEIMMYQRENSFRHSRWGMNRWPSAFRFAVSSCSFIFSFVVIRALAFYILFHCFK